MDLSWRSFDVCVASSILTRPCNAAAMNDAVKVNDVMRALISLIRCLFIYCVIMGINQSAATVYPRPAVVSNAPPMCARGPGLMKRLQQ